MPAGFLDLPAELRTYIYELLYKPKEPVQVRKYLNNRVIRTLTKAKKKAGTGTTNKYWEKPMGASAFMATCRQVYSESCAMLYTRTFHCERMSDFSEFTRTLGSTHSGMIETLQISSYNYHFPARLEPLTGLKTLVVLVGNQKVFAPGWIPRYSAGDKIWQWSRRAQVIEALKKFVEARKSLVRVKFIGLDELPDCRSPAAVEIEAAVVEMDEHIRGLRLS